MLTKKDLQAIKEVVDERLDTRLEEKLGKTLKPIKDNIQIIKKEILPIKSMQGDIKKIRKTTDMMGRIFDKVDVSLHKRVRRIEEHLHLEVYKKLT